MTRRSRSKASALEDQTFVGKIVEVKTKEKNVRILMKVKFLVLKKKVETKVWIKKKPKNFRQNF